MSWNCHTMFTLHLHAFEFFGILCYDQSKKLLKKTLKMLLLIITSIFQNHCVLYRFKFHCWDDEIKKELLFFCTEVFWLLGWFILFKKNLKKGKWEESYWFQSYNKVNPTVPNNFIVRYFCWILKIAKFYQYFIGR